MCSKLSRLVHMAIVLGRAIVRPIRSMVNVARRMSERNLGNVAFPKSRDEMRTLGDAFSHMADRLKGIIGLVVDSSNSLAASSQRISSSSRALAEKTLAHSSTIEETAAAVEQLSSSVDQVTAYAQGQAKV